MSSWFSSRSHSRKERDDDVSDDELVQTAILGDTDPSLKERPTRLYYSMNTDTRTCQDVITELGYPYEAICVVTSDGYVLQHGILDSSMGWVSNGVVGSPAFAAYDQGYDVFLGTFGV